MFSREATSTLRAEPKVDNDRSLRQRHQIPPLGIEASCSSVMPRMPRIRFFSTSTGSGCLRKALILSMSKMDQGVSVQPGLLQNSATGHPAATPAENLCRLSRSYSHCRDCQASLRTRSMSASDRP
jgi:hypothetical protein